MDWYVFNLFGEISIRRFVVCRSKHKKSKKKKSKEKEESSYEHEEQHTDTKSRKRKTPAELAFEEAKLKKVWMVFL